MTNLTAARPEAASALQLSEARAQAAAARAAQASAEAAAAAATAALVAVMQVARVLLTHSLAPKLQEK